MSGMDLLPFLNVTCTECQDLGPPPNSILAIPPPPLPGFLLRPPTPDNHTPSCGALCDWNPGHAEFVELLVPEAADSSETHEPPSGTQLGAPTDDTWFLVLVTSCVGVLVLSFLLTLFLLRLKQDRSSKVSLSLDPGVKSCEAVLYPGSVGDSRVLWTTLTPRGPATTLAPTQGTTTPSRSFDNSGYIDPDDYLRLRPRVSSPTRIEHPNLPPLNLHRALRRESSDTAPIV
ncbi:uncharacterized protein LOC128992396 isoform X2 [Macrosteles quadrilineatus]|uniref:uncharacterized protein LOC128992396 isoform X2 n=1 Tax=Macrosteles quadrilineatus TaxID=74068 RepID=UPI0023E2844D|nr:uncharacterized protein LOC128992396 isoform X2 [Macrosteles quadrilineatus]